MGVQGLEVYICSSLVLLIFTVCKCQLIFAWLGTPPVRGEFGIVLHRLHRLRCERAFANRVL